jgi:hypothetical protein
MIPKDLFMNISLLIIIDEVQFSILKYDDKLNKDGALE